MTYKLKVLYSNGSLMMMIMIDILIVYSL